MTLYRFKPIPATIDFLSHSDNSLSVAEAKIQCIKQKLSLEHVKENHFLLKITNLALIVRSVVW